MDTEKEAIKKIKNSLKVGISRPEIIRRMQKQGYKLEYIDALLKKSGKTRRIAIWFLITSLILIAIATITYSFLFSNQKQELVNPLQGYKVLFGSNHNPSENQNNITLFQTNTTDNKSQEIYLEDITITPDFVSYLLNEIGAYKLHKNPITQKKPIINLNIGEKTFSSKISKGKITTIKGTDNNPDMIFISNKEDIVTAMLSDNPPEIFKQSIQNGNTQIELKSSQTDLYAKGYLTLYNELKGNSTTP